MALTPAELAFPQMLLGFGKFPFNAISANYQFCTGDTIGSCFGSPLFSLGTNDAATDVFTPTSQFVQAGFAAFDPVTVPEPASIVLLGSGLAALGLLRRRRS